MKKCLMTLMTLMTLTACDRIQRADAFDSGPNSRLYKTAMEDYRAGRLDAALAGFEKTVAAEPANASARFQLACLLQDSRRDYAGAYCAYREYLLQQPDSDRAKLARDRLRVCEKEMAKELSSRHGLNGSEAVLKELKSVRKTAKESADSLAAKEKELEAAQERIRVLTAEKSRLVAIVKGVGVGGDVPDTPESMLKEAKSLLSEVEPEETSQPSVKEARDLLDEEDEEVASEMPSQKPIVPKDVKKSHSVRPPASPPANPPAEYKVEEGDTLYAIAKRFYGDIAAWKKIRDANKAVISTDGRLRVGDVIRLPRP